jgi:hypothetical protein
VGYVDSEFTELDVTAEVSSPTDRNNKARNFLSNSFIERIGISKHGSRPAEQEQDPTFKDFNYYCEDPDALVEVSTLVGELHGGHVEEELVVQVPLSPARDISAGGTPLSSFVENGQLDHAPGSLPVKARSGTTPPGFHSGIGGSVVTVNDVCRGKPPAAASKGSDKASQKSRG